MTEQHKSYLMNTALVVVTFLAVILAGADLLDMALGEVVLDIIAGAIGGLAVAALVIWNSRKVHA
jgi:hypothetical protein